MSKNVTMRQLRGFLAVVHEGSFTRAAARLHLTQSALTVTVKSLEAEVGLHLLDRTTRAVSPTEHGRRFAVQAARLLEDFDRALDDLRAYAERERGLVTVAATATVINHILVPALAVLAQRYPGIVVRLLEELTEGAARRLQSGEVDFAITTLPVPDPTLEAIPFLSDRFELVCHIGHPLARSNRAVSWQVMSAHRRVGLSGQSGVSGILESHEHARVAMQGLRYEASSVAGLQHMVRVGLGITAVPALIAREMIGPSVTRRPLTPAVQRTVYLARRPGRSPTPAANEVVAETVRRLHAVGDRNIEPVVDAASLTAIGFGDA